MHVSPVVTLTDQFLFLSFLVLDLEITKKFFHMKLTDYSSSTLSLRWYLLTKNDSYEESLPQIETSQTIQSYKLPLKNISFSNINYYFSPFQFKRSRILSHVM